MSPKLEERLRKMVGHAEEAESLANKSSEIAEAGVADEATVDGTPKLKNIPDSIAVTGNYHIKLNLPPNVLKRTSRPQALRFHGKNERVNIDVEDVLKPPQNLTVAVAFRVFSISREWTPILYKGGKKDTKPGYRDLTLWVHHDRHIHLSLFDGTINYNLSTAPGALTLGSWCNVLASIDYETGILGLSINQQQPVTMSYGHIPLISATPLFPVVPPSTGQLTQTDTHLWLGWWNDNEQNPGYCQFDGEIESVRIWNTPVLQRSDDQDAYALNLDALSDATLLASCSFGAGNDGRLTVVDSGPHALSGVIKGDEIELADSTCPPTTRGGLSPSQLKVAFEDARRNGVFDPAVFPNLGSQSTVAARRLAQQAIQAPAERANQAAGENTAGEVVDLLVKHYQKGEYLHFYPTLAGTWAYRFLAAAPQTDPFLFLVETYQFVSYAGSCGPGRVVKVLSLLPGEKSELTISTYETTDTEESRTSSVLDSASKESAADFQSDLATEQSQKSDSSTHFEASLDATVDVNWGFGSAHVDAKTSGGSKSSREDFAKSVSKATHKNSSRASSKRDIQVNSTSKTTTGERKETAITRHVENINLSRALNFKFYQLNQEYETFLVLTDVKVGYLDGAGSRGRIVPLYELDALLADIVLEEPETAGLTAADLKEIKTVLKEKTASEYVRDLILDEVSLITDWEGNTHHEGDLPEKTKPDPTNVFLVRETTEDGRITAHISRRFRQGCPGTDHDYELPGIIISKDTTVLRTADSVVTTELGDGKGLDGYSEQLQKQATREKKLENDLLQADRDRQRLALRIVEENLEEAATRYREIFLSHVVQRGNGSNEGKLGQG